MLAQRGFDVGEPDGRLGGKTRNALRQFQSAVGEVPDGFASEAILAAAARAGNAVGAGPEAALSGPVSPSSS